MKVAITLTEVITYEITKEIEITTADYETYIKTGKLPNKKDFDVNCELSGDIDDEHHIETEHWIDNIEKI